MESAFDHKKYTSIVFMDSMVALEGKPLETMPWHEIDPTGPILILVVPQVNSEIDKRKRDGRLGPRARAFNRLIAPAAETAAPHRIVEGPSPVDIAIARCARINWDLLDDLDPNEGDDRVVAQILHARDVPNDRKQLLSHDTNPIAIASRHDLKCRRLPNHWLLAPEPSPSEKEVARLKARVRELEDDQPLIELSLEFGLTQPQRIFRIEPLPDDAQKAFVSHILRANPPMQSEARSPFVIDLDYYDSGYNDRYRGYRTKVVPAYAASAHRLLEIHYGQVPFVFSLKNAGYLQAEGLVLRLTAKGGSLHDRFSCYPIFGPAAPRPATDRWLPKLGFHPRDLRTSIVGRHEMDFAVGPNRSDTVEVHCADFRHGRAWDFEGIATIDPEGEGPFVVEVEVTASNMRGIRSQTFQLPYIIEQAKVGELVDLLNRSYRVPIPMMDRFTDEVKAMNKDWIEFVAIDD
ncbi:hypothetical protein LGH82_19180 [Mesorhizobium sp. PAMC28654]|uniref:hypothetical protein n=1 Tax=Mesorhizobium sp. PAMC28654 TaxID=2880934 RepID=UPI001D0B8A91|nr:hypothetical protein [Mesorhizobium sp. PAMC28654]UDL87313.1 hypothetical protein LGH82_19180 [Mesorhizobium sp. PAMC28654]